MNRAQNAIRSGVWKIEREQGLHLEKGRGSRDGGSAGEKARARHQKNADHLEEVELSERSKSSDVLSHPFRECLLKGAGGVVWVIKSLQKRNFVDERKRVPHAEVACRKGLGRLVAQKKED